MEVENSIKIEIHHRTNSLEEEPSDIDDIDPHYTPLGQSSFEEESEEVEVEQRQLAYPSLPVYKSPMPSPSIRDRIGLLTPTEELSEEEQSIAIVIMETPSKIGGPGLSSPQEANRHRVTFDPLESPVRGSISPDPEDVDDPDLTMTFGLSGERINDLISRQELVLNWQEKHQHHLNSQEFTDLLQSSTEMDPSTIMKSLRTMPPSHFAPMVQQMADSLTAYQSQLAIFNTIGVFGDRLRELQPFEYNLDLLPLLKKLCSLVGDTRSASPDLTSASTLSKLIRGAGPGLVTEDLLYIINGTNMKRKPAAMDGLTYALLTFPRDDFDLEKIAEAVSHCLWEPKRRVRQAALECLAVVAHVLGPGIAMPFLRELIEQNRPVDTTENPSSAVSARVSRRLLPSPSTLGLIEYGLTLPSKQVSTSRGSLEPVENGGLDPIPSKGDYGPDILWILHGTSGSAEQSKMSSARSSTSSSRRGGVKSSKSAVTVGLSEIEEHHRGRSTEDFLRQKHREFVAFQESEETRQKEQDALELEERNCTDFNLNEDCGCLEEPKTIPRDRDSGVGSLKSVRVASPTESTASSKSLRLVPDEAGGGDGEFPVSPPSSDDLLDEPFVLLRPVLARSSRSSSLTAMASQTGRVQHSPPPPIGTVRAQTDTEPTPSTSSSSNDVRWLKKSCPTKIPRNKSKPRGRNGVLAPPPPGPPPSVRSPHDQVPGPATSRTKDSPKHLLAQALTQLSSADWEVNLDGFGMLTRILHSHPEFLRSELVTVNRAALLHLSNLRTQVTRAACLFFEELFVTFGKSMEQECEKIAEKLLDKTADTNKFIREASTSALESMILHLPPSKTIQILENYGARHRNTVVRCTTAHVTRLLVQQLGAERILHQNPQRVLPLLIKFLQEGSLETRTHAKHGLACLVVHGSFDPALKRYIPSSTLKLVEKTITSIKNDLIRKSKG